MDIGVLKEIKTDEYRVSLTPAGARELASSGHTVFVQRGAGEGSALSDEAYAAAGATILPDADTVFQEATLLLKVKEPLTEEYLRLRPDHVLFTYLHLAPSRELTQGLIDSGATCVAYETVETPDGRLPLLAPMSEIAGRIAAQAGAYFLERMNGGKGRLLGGATGVAAAKVVILGGGIAGSNAALIAAGMRAQVKVLDVDMARLMELERYLPTVQGLDEQPADHRRGDPRGRPADRRRAGAGSQGAHAGVGRSRQGHAARFGHRGYQRRPGRVHRDVAHDHAQRSHLRHATG